MFFFKTSFEHTAKLRYSAFILALFWVLGISAGVYFAGNGADSSLLLMRTLVLERVSIIPLIILRILPLFLSFTFVYFSVFTPLYLIAFLKAFSFSYSSFLIFLFFNSAAWLAWPLLLFSDFFSLGVAFALWLRAVYDRGHALVVFLLKAILVTVFAGCVDYYLIIPFFRTLFDKI